MKAIEFTRYGGPDQLKPVDRPTPVPERKEVKVRVHATSINSWDWDMLWGKHVIPLMNGLFRPRKIKVMGLDVAGVVEEIGSDITRWKVGDRVYGDLSAGKWGGLSEFTCAREDELTSIPNELTFSEAAALPHASLLALQALQHRELKEGDEVLFIGAGGGVGTLALQMAHTMKVSMTMVDRADKLDYLSALGATAVIDYQDQDFSHLRKTYDLIIDVVSNRSLAAYHRALKPGGLASIVGGYLPLVFFNALSSPIRSPKGKRFKILAHRPNAGLEQINEWVRQGALRPVIDRQFGLDETQEAFRYFGSGTFKGKIVINVV